MRWKPPGVALIAVGLLTVQLPGHAQIPIPELVRCFGSLATIVGSDGDDVLIGTADSDVIAGLGGHDVIAGLGRGDAICGGAGDDEILGGLGNDGIEVGRGADVAQGGPGIDLITEFSRDRCGPCLPLDPRARDADVDRLFGGSGIDILSGEGGNDRLDGGSGPDITWHLSRFTSAFIDLGKGVAISSAGGTDELVSIEHASGSVNDDVIWGDDGFNYLAGSAGRDSVRGLGGGDWLWADFDGDLLDGGDEDEAADTIGNAMAESVTIDLSRGMAYSNEIAHGHFPNVLIGFENARGGHEDDTIIGDASSNLMEGGHGDDELVGNEGDDWIYGEFKDLPAITWGGLAPGNDSLDGGDGRDRLDGGPLYDSCINGEVLISCEEGEPPHAESVGAMPRTVWWIESLDIEYESPELLKTFLDGLIIGNRHSLWN